MTARPLAIAGALAVLLAAAPGLAAPAAPAARTSPAPTASPDAAAFAALSARLSALETQVSLIQDKDQIEKLTRAFGYYGDKGQWDQVADLFATDSRVEIAGRGVYYGRDGASRLFLGAVGGGKIGLPEGRLLNHMVLQGIVDVAPDGQTARGRWREFVQVGQYQKMASWSEGVMQVVYVKENGVWKFRDLQWFASFYSPYADGWGKTATGNNGPSETYPPDAPPSLDYDVYPGHYVPPFHYPHPVTGRVWTPADTRLNSTWGVGPRPRPMTAPSPAAPLSESKK